MSNAVSAPCKRLLTRAEAAAYCGMSVPTFEGICPVRPIDLGGGRRLERYDVECLNEWIDRLHQPTPGLTRDQALAKLDDD